MNKEEFKEVCINFTKDKDFQLNPDEKIVDMVTKGLFNNLEKHGLRLCPCRLPDGTYERYMELICPCNFKTHETWKTKGSCHCNLFVRKNA